MSPGVVGREPELAAVDRFLNEAADGFAVLVLEGEAGIGKTTVWREARARAQQRGYRLLTCRPSATEAKFSFAGVADLLSTVEEEGFSSLPEPQRESLEVALLRAGPRSGKPVSRAVAAGFLALTRDMAAKHDLLLAVDDLQWLDIASRRVLEFAARRLESERVGLLCSIRSPVAGPLLGGAVADERLSRVVLGPLSLAALGRIVADRLGRSLPRPLLMRMLQASGGNPFHALEVARLIADHDAESERGLELPVPEDLRKLTAARIGRLPADTREAVLLAAVLASPHSGTVDLNALAPAEQAGIATVTERGDIEFAHPLFASAAYGSVPIARRQELHRRAAELVTDPEQRARHLALASSAANASIAGQLDEAAASAAARGASEAAAELSELAAERTPASDPQARAQRLLSAARFEFDSGDLARAEALAQRVIDRQPSDPLRARALRLAARLNGRRNTFTEATRLALEALEVAGDDARLRADIEVEIAYCSASLGNLQEAAQYAQAAVAHSEEARDDGLLAEALAVRTIARFMGGQGLEQRALDRALKLEDRTRVHEFPLNPRYIQGILRLWCGQLLESLETHLAVQTELVDRGQEGFIPLLLLYQVQASLWMGEFRQAERFAAKADETAALLEDPTATAIARGAGALVHAHDGRTELARREALEALALFERLEWRPGAIWPLWALGLVELSEGNPAGVDGVLRPLTEQLMQMPGGDPSLFVFLPDELEALIELGELERAAAYLEPFEHSAYKLGRHWAVAAAERCRGAIYAVRGDSDAAFAAFERALAAHGRTPMPFERARTLLLAGQAYRRYKQRRRAREALAASVAAFKRLGAQSWGARAGDELARVGRTPGAEDELTATERRVAELAASGLSNQEVAERAFLSVKSVEANLTRVYRKLRVRSRVELANALRAQR